MDCSKLAQDVLAIAGERGLVSENLGEMERNLKGLLDQIGQAALQMHVSTDARPGYEGSSRVCRCGRDQKFVEYRQRTIEAFFGPLTYRRAYYHCRYCGAGTFPFDESQGLGKRQVSVALSQAVVELAEAMPFRQAAEKLEKLLGRKLSANTINRITQAVGTQAATMEQEAAAEVQANRHAVRALPAGRLYMLADGAMVHRLDGWHETKVFQCCWQDPKARWQRRHLCRNEEVGKFAGLAWAVMHACGLENARQSILLGDGIPWIWNHLGPLADEAVQIVDWYHAKEHLYAAARVLHGEGTAACQQLAQALEALLWNSQIDELLQSLKVEHARLRRIPKRAAIEELQGYLERHRSRMDYKNYRDQGLNIGSGAIEGDCKNLIHARMKRGSPRWSDQGCQAMLSLRCCYANREQHRLWQRKPLLAA